MVRAAVPHFLRESGGNGTHSNVSMCGHLQVLADNETAPCRMEIQDVYVTNSRTSAAAKHIPDAVC